MKTKIRLEKELKFAKQIKFRNCLVCEKQYSLRRSSTKRYCSRKCSYIAERIRDWENKRGMNIREIQSTLTQTNEIIKLIEEGCGREINPYKKIKMPCGGIAGGKPLYCEQCEELLTKIKGNKK